MLKIDDLVAEPRAPTASLLNIEDSGIGRSSFPSPMVVTTRVHLLVVLSPPLLAELVARRLEPLDVEVAIVAADEPVPEGHYDVVVRNVALPPGVSADLVVDLPSPDRAGPPMATPEGEPVSVDRIDEVADLLVRRWPSLGLSD
jgi:hypothetical protein